jgi:hypothetical protein
MSEEINKLFLFFSHFMAKFWMSVFRQSKKNLYKEKHSYKSKHNKVQTINDINFKNRTPKIMSFCQDY